MNAAYKAKPGRGLRFKSQRFRLLAIVAGCFVISVTFVLSSKPDPILSMNLGFFKVSFHKSQGSITANKAIYPQELTEDFKVDIIEESVSLKPEDEAEKSNIKQSTQSTDHESVHEITLADNVIQKEQKTNANQITLAGDVISKKWETSADQSIAFVDLRDNGDRHTSQKPLCDFSDSRTNICEMSGDIRIHPNSSSIIVLESAGSEKIKSWKIRPYPRKGDALCLSRVTELAVKSSREAPQCTKNHTTPALVFSIGGYTGNLFHDFSDVLIPLFLTARRFNGDVQFVVTDVRPWWLIKYGKFLRALSFHPAIDVSTNSEVHCFKHTIVGLQSHKELMIDPSRTPDGCSTQDFTQLIRTTFSLERDTVIPAGELRAKRPRFVIIARKATRRIINIDEVVKMAEELGFKPLVQEADVGSDIAQFAQIVNSCDVMLGIHGAGLTNEVFLPPNATLVQVVPWGGLEWIAMMDYGDPAMAMGLRYLQYSITVEESSLMNKYPRDHEIFKDPTAFHKRGFEFIKRTFMDPQDVTIDVRRLRSLLVQAFENPNQ